MYAGKIKTLAAIILSAVWLYVLLERLLNLPFREIPEFAVLGMLMAYVFAHPLSEAYLTGLREARDPSIRITPGGAWFHFYRRFRPAIKGDLWLWALYFPVMAGTFLAFEMKDNCWILIAMIVQSAGWVNLMGFILAPFCRSASLLTGLLVSTYTLMMVGEISLILSGYLSWSGWKIGWYFAGTGLAMMVLLALLVWYVRRKSDWWFRFED